MIRLAKKASQKSQCNNMHGAVISRKNSVLGVGCNLYKEHPKWGAKKVHSKNHFEFFTIHAEANAIRQAVSRGIDLNGTSIYVARTGSKNQMSKPCASCQKLIQDHGIRKVYYTDENGEVVQTWPLYG